MIKQYKNFSFSLAYLFLAVVYLLSLSSHYGLELMSYVNELILKYTSYSIHGYILDIIYFFIIVIPLFLLFLSVWFGFKSLKLKESIGSKFRILAITSISIAVFLLCVMSWISIFGL